MANINATEANAWLESTKLTLTSIEAALESQIAAMIMGRLQPIYNTAGWTTETNTPKLVRMVITMYYVAAIYDRAYTDDNDDSTNNYAGLLRSMADANLSGLLSGTVILPEFPDEADFSSVPSFFPTDASSALEPTDMFPENGGPAFVMGSIF